MAFDQGGFWLVHFTTPATDHKLTHLMQISGTDNEATARKHFFTMHANPDAVVKSFKRIQSPQVTADALAALLKDAPVGFRMLQDGEAQLTQRQVDILHGKTPAPINFNDPEAVAAEMRSAELLAAKAVVTDP